MLDASALLTYLLREPGFQLVRQAIADSAAISLVNWAEVLTAVVRSGRSLDEVEAELTAADILGRDGLLTLVEVTAADARLAADLYPVGSPAGLSLADRICIATALRLGLPIYTADRAWTTVTVPGADVRLIRP